MTHSKKTPQTPLGTGEPGPRGSGSLGTSGNLGNLDSISAVAEPRRGREQGWTLRLLIDAIGAPAPEPRPRSAGHRRGVYVPETAHVWKHQVRAACVLALSETPPGLAELVLPTFAVFGVDLEFRFARPKSHWRTGRNAGRLRDRAPRGHFQTPDIDNLVKAALDALGAWDDLPSLVWLDDSHVVWVTAGKRWALLGETAGAEIRVYTEGAP